jgi:hypothetical protein
LIRRLQLEHLPLAEIRRRLESLSDTDIETLSTADAPPPPADSALEYVRAILAGPALPTPVPTPTGPPGQPAIAQPAMAQPLMRRMDAAESWPRYASEGPPSEVPPAAAPASVERSQWERIALAPDVELHIRRPLTRTQQKGVDRLVTIARELLEEDRS